jgi:hypothetical protein
VLSPAQHPWYVTWIVPLLVLRPAPAFVFLAASASLLHAPLARWGGRAEWCERAWRRLLELRPRTGRSAA